MVLMLYRMIKRNKLLSGGLRRTLLSRLLKLVAAFRLLRVHLVPGRMALPEQLERPGLQELRE